MILIVEDNEANQLLASSELEREGYLVEVAANSLEARQVLDRTLPELILMDIQLPGLDGLTFTRQLKAEVATAHIPVVGMTAAAMAGDRKRSFAAGCAGYISKPIDITTFVSDVRGFLAAKAPGQAQVPKRAGRTPRSRPAPTAKPR